MHILVTNDDGVQAPGLLALAQAMRTLGQVTVFAPDRNWSASGHVKTLDRPLRVREVRLADGSAAYSSDGAPSDCVALPLMGFVEEKIDVVVAGINPNANIGHDVTYSGTVTAAMEAVITGGVPGIAISLDAPEYHSGALDYSTAASVARRVAAKVLAEGLPEGVLLNVNVPYLKENELKGLMVTRQGLRLYRDKLERRLDPRGRPYYWIGGEAPTGVDEPGTDFGALRAGYVSITPLQLDLTAREAMEKMRRWTWEA
ncbi:MAG: 5'/3'-nucleotidase SurE [Anaerolineales bacterium]|nr:5'/3'-nucleotidase SurE [Anaerolineales bacterium]MDP2976360.1 5'/3'-nucleotidase SurE [Anaerolineales bacterium]MDP3185187.1 5'/3'-nucleotidase SurE [Anaerolineales bacterium]